MTLFSKKRWQKLAGVLVERSTPESSQDLTAYFGSDGSIDGPYVKVSNTQPFEDDKHRKKFLKSIHAEATLEIDLYPDTAAEYALELNKNDAAPFILCTEQKHWDNLNIYSGRDLAEYLTYITQ